jgi:geranylgeranyl diphosphate synthase type I
MIAGLSDAAFGALELLPVDPVVGEALQNLADRAVRRTA